MPLVITSVRDGYTDTHFMDKINLWCDRHAPGLEIIHGLQYNQRSYDNYDHAFWCFLYCFFGSCANHDQEVIP